MIAAGIVSLLIGQAVLTYFWISVAQFYGDRPMPFLEWVPSYPERSMRFLAAGVLLMCLGLSLSTSELDPWQAGLIAGVVMALSAVPVYAHNLELRHRRLGATLVPTD